jgi:hypothetical protein
VPIPATLPAGVNTLQVVRQLLMGAPPLRDMLESNVAAFLLQPTVRTIAVDPMNAGNDPRSTIITVTLSPLVLQAQKVTLLLNQLNPPPGQPAAFFVFDSPPRALPPTATVPIPVTNVPAGDYFLRVRVDGADSSLTTDVNGLYNGPKVTL